MFLHKHASPRRWVLPWSEMSHFLPSGQLPQHGVNSCSPSKIEFVSTQPHSWGVILYDTGCLLGERNWHKLHPNRSQKQRIANEVLIAFIKTLTKELKWQKCPSPTQDSEERAVPKEEFNNNHQWLLLVHCRKNSQQTLTFQRTLWIHCLEYIKEWMF